jgi:hypothetical protein
MSQQLIFLPVFVQVLVTLYAYVLLGIAKPRAARAGLVDEARRALHDDAWPDSVRQINNNIRNQFELPVLFYVLVIVLWATGAADLFAQAVAWLFALSRIVHVRIHTGSNYVPRRRRVFMFGVLMVAILLVMAVVALLPAMVALRPGS